MANSVYTVYSNKMHSNNCNSWDIWRKSFASQPFLQRSFYLFFNFLIFHGFSPVDRYFAANGITRSSVTRLPCRSSSDSHRAVPRWRPSGLAPVRSAILQRGRISTTRIWFGSFFWGGCSQIFKVRFSLSSVFMVRPCVVISVIEDAIGTCSWDSENADQDIHHPIQKAGYVVWGMGTVWDADTWVAWPCDMTKLENWIVAAGIFCLAV